MESGENGVERVMNYFNILQLKEDGFSISKISKKLSLSRNTVKKYLKMTPVEMEDWVATLKTREKKLDPYRETILTWLKEHPDLTGAQIHDWLDERCDYKMASENTVRNFVNEVRKFYHIPKTASERVYSAMEELPMGFQAQVDFGQDVLVDENGNPKRGYFIAFVLSHSRHKYFEWLDRPFKTSDVVRCHENAFLFYGGMPEEMVYDQDALIAVSENSGDIIYTAEFQRYRDLRKFKVYLCRKADPESKGKIENVVKFIKRNFSNNRTYSSLESLNEQSLSWLNRTGNYKVHNTTKKRPFEVHALEKQHLKKVSLAFSHENSTIASITRNVHKDNVIRFAGNRYTVPVGTYKKNSSNLVYLDTKIADRLQIRLKTDGAILADHPISKEKGKLIKDASHERGKSSKTELLSHQVREAFEESHLIDWYLNELKAKYPRHMIDQLKVMQNVIRTHPEQIQAGLEKAKTLNLISANDYRDIVYSLHREAAVLPSPISETDGKYDHLKAVERDTDLYVKVLGGVNS